VDLCIQAQAMLRHVFVAWLVGQLHAHAGPVEQLHSVAAVPQVKLCLVVNKLDRLILELRLTPLVSPLSPQTASVDGCLGWRSRSLSRICRGWCVCMRVCFSGDWLRPDSWALLLSPSCPVPPVLPTAPAGGVRAAQVHHCPRQHDHLGLQLRRVPFRLLLRPSFLCLQLEGGGGLGCLYRLPWQVVPGPGPGCMAAAAEDGLLALSRLFGLTPAALTICAGLSHGCKLKCTLEV
jgi:hypothetical protein